MLMKKKGLLERFLKPLVNAKLIVAVARCYTFVCVRESQDLEPMAAVSILCGFTHIHGNRL
jgi:hypothetical protein